MSKSTRNLLVLVGSVVILSLILFAVGPVVAQSGTGGQTGSGSGQGGNTVVVSSSDTLGTLVARYNLSGSNLRDFLSLNANLPLVPGQRVTFPPGVTVNIPATGQGTNGSQSQGTTSTNTPVATVAATGTPAATLAATGTPAATVAATNTPAAAVAATNTPVATTAANSSASSANSSANTTGSAQTVHTYVVQQGDTLGTLLNAMGFQASGVSNTGSAAATSTPMATSAATATTAATTAATATPTTAAMTAATATTAATTAASSGSAAATSSPMATSAATATTAATSAATATTAATTAATPTTAAMTAATPTTAAMTAATATTAATTVSTATPVATTAASGSTSTTGGPTDAQLQQFVRLNSTLRFGVVISLPAGVPATGGTNGTNGTSGTSGSNGTSGTTSNNGSSNANGNANGSSSAVVGSPLTRLSGQAANNAACSTGAPKGFGYYKIRGGDSLQSISKAFGVPVSTILELNRGSAFAKGNIILLPGVEAPGKWNVKSFCP